MSEWISVKDRLPQRHQMGSIFIVALYNKKTDESFVKPLHYIMDEWFSTLDEEPLNYRYKVTHWMPLPEPPKDNQ